MFRSDLKRFKYVVVIGPSQRSYDKPGLHQMAVGFAKTLEGAVKKAENPSKLWRYGNFPSDAIRNDNPSKIKHWDIYGVFEIVERYEPYWLNTKKGKALKALAGSKYPEPNGAKRI